MKRFSSTMFIFLSFLAYSYSIAVKDDDPYHPSQSKFRRFSEDKRSSPWEGTDWNKLAQDELDEAMDVADNAARRARTKAKNVILFIGDGMGVSTLAAARLYHGESRNLKGTDTYLAWEKFPHVGLSRTYNVDRATPDSAATATAFLCGVKANFETIGVSDQNEFDNCEKVNVTKVLSIAKKSIQQDKWAGVVTTTRITHATPAGAYAHVANRDWEAYVPDNVVNHDKCQDIALQLVTDELNQKMRVILGGGIEMFVPNNYSISSSVNGSRRDGRNLINEWLDLRSKESPGVSYKFVTNKTDFDAADAETTDYLFGLFKVNHMSYEADRNPSMEPSLAEMTEKAINMLKRSPNGYFLLVEGGRIDHAHHGTNAFKSLNDTIAMSDAVKKAKEMTDDDDDTLIVVSADHSHVFTFGGYGSFDLSVFDLSDIDDGDDGKPFLQMNYANGPSYYDHRTNNGSLEGGEIPRKNLTGEDVKDPEFRQDTGIPLYSETHGGEDVAIYASGPMSHLFHGNHEQHYIAHVMMFASCVADYQNKPHCSTDPATDSATSKFTSTLTLASLVVLKWIVVPYY